MKLGFLLQITQAGNPSDGFSVNKEDSWAHQASDVRTSIKVLNNYYGTEKVVYLVKFLGSLGYLICVIKASPEGSPRPDDNTAAWIFFPANIAISSDETIKILNAVEEAISQEKRTDYELLERIFGREYEANDVLISAVGSINSRNEANYAVRYYNADFTLNELLGTSIAQQEYGMYRGLILIDKNKDITHSSNFELNFEPKKICIFNPIPPADGFTPCFPVRDKYQPFNKAIEVPEGGQVTIHWVRNGYAIIKKTFIAKEGPVCPDSAHINPNEYKIIVSREHFHIYDPNNQPVLNPEISINGVLMDGDAMEISESIYNDGVRLIIRAKGLSDYRKDNEKLSSNMQIFMGHHFYNYDFEIPLRNEKEKIGYASFSIETNHKLKNCPIEGYETYDYNYYESNRGVNRLSKSSDLKLKIRYFVYGVTSVILSVFIFTMIGNLDNYEFQLGWPPIKRAASIQRYSTPQFTEDVIPEDPKTIELQRAIDYLEGNETWHKDSLNNFEATDSLFYALNDFNLDYLKQLKDSGLYKSAKFNDIVGTLSDYLDSGKDPHIGKENNEGKYNSPTDNGISVTNYKKWLSEKHSPYVAPTDVNNKSNEQKSKITGKKAAPVPTKPQTESGQQDKPANKRGKL